MFEWFRKLRQRARDIVLPKREEREPRNQSKVNLKPYTPEPRVFLGQLAYLQLSQFEILTNELKFSPNTQYKAELSEAAARSFAKYRGLSKTMATLGIDATDAMDPFTERVQTFHSRTAGLDWYEAIIKIYLVSGFLDDFYRRLAAGLPTGIREEVEKSLNDKTFEKFAVKVLTESMVEDDQLASRLAVWGRRLMGDVLLEMRAAFDNRKLAGVPKNASLTLDEERKVNLMAYSKLEPLVSELMATHTMRMDALGLTA